MVSLAEKFLVFLRPRKEKIIFFARGSFSSFRFLFCILFLIVSADFVFADVYSSDNFKVLDPVVDLGGGRSTSASFDLLQAFGQYILGTSTATNFSLESGFLAFPEASAPALTATAGANKAVLSWTAAQAFAGWTVTSYELGIASASGGPYTYSNVGNVLTYTQTSLTAGTAYYFILRAEDAFGNTIATSTEASATPTAAPVVAAETSSANRGGGGIFLQFATQADFSGKACPSCSVVLLKDSQIYSTTVADKDGNFSASAQGFSPGDYIFSIYVKDIYGNISGTMSFPLSVETDSVLEFKNVFLPPTVSLDKIKVKQGENFLVSGQSIAGSSVVVYIEPENIFVSAKADERGDYSYSLSSVPLNLGKYGVKARSYFIVDGLPAATAFSRLVDLEIGLKDIFKEIALKCPEKSDFNADCRVNLTDFSILIYWLNKTDVLEIPAKVDLNRDGVVDIFDFSILAYYWTG